MQQSIRYLTTSDGARLAWASMGTGVPLVKAANWLSHLEYDLESPIWRHWVHFFGDAFPLRALRRARLRHDRRRSARSFAGALAGRPGSGGRRGRHRRTVRAARHLAGRGGVRGLCGQASRIACRKLLLYGAYARGPYERGNEEAARLYHAIADVARGGWADENPVFRQLFTARFIPDATEAQVRWFNELARTTTTAEAAGALLDSRGHINVTSMLGQVTVPTLVMHARHDGVVPLEEGRLLAAGIPDSRFVELESRNHVLLEHEPAWERFCSETLRVPGRRARRRCDAGRVDRARARDRRRPGRRPHQRGNRRRAVHQRQDRAQCA